MRIRLDSYRADARCFESEKTMNEKELEFDLSEVDYITSDGFATIIKLMKQGKSIKFVNVNQHIEETIRLIRLEDIL